jgi:hypothetical protein
VEAASTLPEDERYGPGFGFPSSRPQKICVNLRNLRIEKAPPAASPKQCPALKNRKRPAPAQMAYAGRYDLSAGYCASGLGFKGLGDAFRMAQKRTQFVALQFLDLILRNTQSDQTLLLDFDALTLRRR